MLTITLMLVGVLVISMVSTNNTARSSTHEYPVVCCETHNIISDSVCAIYYNQALDSISIIIYGSARWSLNT